jgi:hypothetical protein
MSTTWVFLGLLAGRELAMTLSLRHRETADAGRIVLRDAAKAFAGLAVSVVLAFGLPLAHSRLLRETPAEPPPAATRAVEETQEARLGPAALRRPPGSDPGAP